MIERSIVIDLVGLAGVLLVGGGLLLWSLAAAMIWMGAVGILIWMISVGSTLR